MNSIKEILIDLGYDVSRGSSTDYSCLPKYRYSDNPTALSVNKVTGEFYDFVTSQKGSFKKLIRITLNFQNDIEVEKWLENKEYHIEDKQKKPILKLPKVYEEIFLLPNNFFFNERGINDKTLKFFESGLASGGQMYQRYAFPIKDETGSIVGYAGRLVVEKEAAKWKILGKKSNFIYPYYYIRNQLLNSEVIVLVESIGNMLALYECGIYSLVMFGVSLSPALLNKLIEINPKKIIIATDNDSENSGAGNVAADEIEKKLLKFFDSEKIYQAIPTHEKDLGNIFQKFGKDGIMKWWDGIFLDL